MALKRVVTVAVAAVLMTALGASANQPDVKVTDLEPMFDTSNAVTLLMVDPWAETDLHIRQVQGYATLDVDADPFAIAAR